MNQGIRFTWITVALASALLGGCKAAPAPSVGFADPKILKNDPNIPFDKFWLKPGLDWTGKLMTRFTLPRSTRLTCCK
jgi:hypothetical protein